jgi:hypothetical protein
MHLGRHHYFSAPPSRDAFAALAAVGVILLYTAMRPLATASVRVRTAASVPVPPDEHVSAGGTPEAFGGSSDGTVEQGRWAAKYGRRLRPGAMDGILFPIVASGEICFRQGSPAADLRAASEWLESNPDWQLRALRYEQCGAAELAEQDAGSKALLWLLVEQGDPGQHGP